MMQEGRDLRDKGDLKTALQRFKGADEIMHVPTTGLEVARTQVALGLLVEALDTIATIHKVPSAADDPQPFKDARLKADELDAQVESKVPSLSINVTGGAEGEIAAISVDGVSLPTSAAGVPRKVDPGRHVITARAASGEAREEVTVAEGEKKDVMLTIVAGGGGGEGGEQPDKGTTEGGTVVHSPSGLTYVGVVVGVLGIAAGTVTGIMTLGKASDVKNDTKDCPNKQCIPGTPGADALSSGNTLATVSTISFGVGVAGAALAVVSLVLGHKQHDAAPSAAPASDTEGNPSENESPGSQSRLHVSPWIGLGSAGLSGTF
jgi:hypothetical protein